MERKKSYLESLKEEASYTQTLNGAKTYSSAGDACLDFFAVAGGMRYRSASDQIALFDRAYIETPELAMKLLFHIRDIRGGMGERKLFRTLLRHVACTWPESAGKNVDFIAQFGRFDDLLCLLDTPVQEKAVHVIKCQMDKDLKALEEREAGNADARISLLAKWLPSNNTSSRRTRKLAYKLIHGLGMDSRQYRRKVTALRSRIAITEHQLSEAHCERIRYETVPAQAMLKYRKAFKRHDRERFRKYLNEVKSGNAVIHTETLFPYEILRPFFYDGGVFFHDFRDSSDGWDVLELLWKKLPGMIGNANAISVVDTSGSMYWGPGALTPALVSQAMGLYCAERCHGAFHNHLITFESNPHLVKIHGKNLAEKLMYISTLPWGGSTNLEAVFDLILETAVRSKAEQSELPAVIYIFSDMEFNLCMKKAGMTVYENARNRFESYGYRMPAVVFHNVNSWQMQTPVTGRTKGTALSSGAATHTMSYKFDGNITPMDHMLRVLTSERYAMIHA